MKIRSLIPFVALFALASSVLAQGEPPAAQTFDTIERVLQQAVQNEQVAQARYAAFEKKAAEEGYAGAAGLFRAVGLAEKIHEQWYAKLLASRKGSAVSAPAGELVVGSTRDNISAAMEAERRERDSSYEELIEAAKKLGDKEVAGALDTARTAESEHANLMMSSVWSLDSLKNAKTFYVCTHCGYASDVKLASCPSCRKESGKLKAVN